ncbi:MAG: hypothetical protein JXP73_20270 [Deltaproteobacteria bacterium]|nr:hypothetical protein [Deltaproteobacteria bacterium]
MKKLMLGLTCVFAMGLVGCSGGDGTDDAGWLPTPDAAVPVYDSAPVATDTGPAPDPYVWVVIQDTEQIACSTNGPGTDIDGVALYDATGVLGVGMIGSALFTANPLGNACDNADCAGSNCKYAAISLTFTPEDLVARTEGPADATVEEVLSDTGYFSLNAGTLQMQIGDANGLPPAKALKSGDYIKVYEVDQSYIASGAAYSGCTCGPEHYTVALQTAAGALVQLTAVQLDPYNTTCTALTATSIEGCGSTVFMVP